MVITESDLPLDRTTLEWLRDRLGFKGLKAIKDAFKDAHELIKECGGLDKGEIILADGDRQGGILLTTYNLDTGKGRWLI
jgi:hypothetical protein